MVTGTSPACSHITAFIHRYFCLGSVMIRSSSVLSHYLKGSVYYYLCIHIVDITCKCSTHSHMFSSLLIDFLCMLSIVLGTGHVVMEDTVPPHKNRG